MTKGARIYNGEKTVSSISGAGKSGQLHVEEWNQTFSNTIYENKLKMDQRPNCKTRYYKTPRGKHRQNTLWHKLQQYFIGSIS